MNVVSRLAMLSRPAARMLLEDKVCYRATGEVHVPTAFAAPACRRPIVLIAAWLIVLQAFLAGVVAAQAAAMAASDPIKCHLSRSGRRRCERRHGAAKRQDRASMLRPLHLGGSRDHSARCAAR